MGPAESAHVLRPGDADHRDLRAMAFGTGRARDGVEAARVGVGERIVQCVRVAIEALAIPGRCEVRVGADEAAERRVVDAAIHVDECEVVELLVAREAVAGHRGELRQLAGSRHAGPGGLSALAERAEARGRDDVAGCVEDAVGAA